jgi:hypothetical protein
MNLNMPSHICGIFMLSQDPARLAVHFAIHPAPGRDLSYPNNACN